MEEKHKKQTTEPENTLHEHAFEAVSDMHEPSRAIMDEHTLSPSYARSSDQPDMSVRPERQQDKDVQEKIMAHMHALMNEAAATKRNQASDGPASSRPFWAQKQVDILPSEQFGKQRDMTEDEHKPQQQRPLSEADGPSAPIKEPAENQALSAIRDEVMSHMQAHPVLDESYDRLLERITLLEGRVDKHQQDLTALLKLVRQIAAQKEEKPVSNNTPSAKGSWGFGLLLVVILISGIVGWLFWMDPEFMLQFMTEIAHDSFAMTIQLLAKLGVL